MDATTLRQTLSAPLDTVLEKHRADITRLLGPAGTQCQAALANDGTVRTVAEYCHELLPWPIRVAVKKPVFVDYVLANRGVIVARLAAEQATPASAPG